MNTDNIFRNSGIISDKEANVREFSIYSVEITGTPMAQSKGENYIFEY